MTGLTAWLGLRGSGAHTKPSLFTSAPPRDPKPTTSTGANAASGAADTGRLRALRARHEGLGWRIVGAADAWMAWRGDQQVTAADPFQLEQAMCALNAGAADRHQAVIEQTLTRPYVPLVPQTPPAPHTHTRRAGPAHAGTSHWRVGRGDGRP
ncbi:hypothetical protein [Spirillospora albida]|uniref:hypothetical protein n=1 Tax=Spirillospora albida TaxID=58123 RepID=UPI0004C12FAA|nr:hypothetical protein [Spirillospora albida]